MKKLLFLILFLKVITIWSSEANITIKPSDQDDKKDNNENGWKSEHIGLSPTKTVDVEEILTRLDWYIVGEGIYNCVGGAKFSRNKQIEFWFYDSKFFTNHDFNIPKLKYKGTYQVKRNKITVHLEKRMLRRKEWTDFLNNDSKYEEKRYLAVFWQKMVNWNLKYSTILCWILIQVLVLENDNEEINPAWLVRNYCIRTLVLRMGNGLKMRKVGFIVITFI